MSFFKKIKKGLGFNTAKVYLTVEDPISKDAKEIKGTVTVEAQSDQQVNSIKIRFEKLITSGLGLDEETDTTLIASTTLHESFAIKADEEKELAFVLPLPGAQKGVSTEVMGFTVSFGNSNPLDVGEGFFSSNASFEVVVTVDLDDVAIDPTTRERVSII